MTQLLIPAPTFGQQLSGVLAQAGTDIGMGFLERAKRQKTQGFLQTFSDPSSSPLQKINAFMQLPEEIKKSTAPVVAAYIGPQAQSQSELEQLQRFQQGFPAVGQQQQAQAMSAQAAAPQMQQAGIDPQQLQAEQQPQFNPGDITTYSEPQLAQMSALSGLPGRIAQQEQARRQQERSREVEAFKSTNEYREKILSDYEASKSTINRLNRLETLNKENKLTTPLMAKLSEHLGIPLSVLSNPASEEFQKVSQDLMSNITKYYGNRILQVEVENFLKTIPTLMNSKEGKERVIKNMKLLLEPSKIAYDAYKEVGKESGKTPMDLHEKVLEKMEPKLEKLAEEFKRGSGSFAIMIDPSGIERKVPRDKVDAFLQAGGVMK